MALLRSGLKEALAREMRSLVSLSALMHGAVVLVLVLSDIFQSSRII